MPPRPRKGPRNKDITGDYMRGAMDGDERLATSQRFGKRSRNAEANRIQRTSTMRAEQAGDTGDIQSLPIAQVVQVFSLYSEVLLDGVKRLAVIRKTLSRISDTGIVVGDRVRFRITATAPEAGQPEGVIEEVLPRTTILTRADSFKNVHQHPIVANADQMLVVASLVEPAVKWGLIDRTLIAAQGGSLRAIICLNKTDLGGDGGAALQEARKALHHYETMGIAVFETSIHRPDSLEGLRAIIKDRVTVLAGHSGVGKSSLVNAIEPGLQIRTAEISAYTDKGRHTTTSARSYPLNGGGQLIDTPGVKQFGLWGVTRENLADFFPDMTDGTAPDWRRQSYQRISESLGT